MLLSTALLVAMTGATPHPDPMRTDWWASKIGWHFVQGVAPGGVSLAEDFSFGFVQGAIELPDDARWLVSVPVRTADAPAGPGQIVSIRINGHEIGVVEQGATGQTTTLQAIVTGPEFSYNFEFVELLQSPDTIVVLAGRVEPVCAGDFNLDGALDVLDFVEFTNAFVSERIDADIDASGSLDVLDFVRFQNEFAVGCE
jgi:hypothetical protein